MKEKSFSFLIIINLVVFSMLVVSPSLAWKEGNHAGTWAKGQTIKVCVQTPPGNEQQQQEFQKAVDDAIKEWDDAQAEFGGLNLERATENCDDGININWYNDIEEFTSSGGPPVNIHIGYSGLNSRGITRCLKHELGHAEGLGHSAESELMREDAYSKNKGEPPSDDALNSNDPFISPTEDDKAGKKKLYGTAEVNSKSEASSDVSHTEVKWVYDFLLHSLGGFIDVVTKFIIELPEGVGLTDFFVTKLPFGWNWNFIYGGVTPGGRFDDGEGPSHSLLKFYAISPDYGLAPGTTALFQVISPLAPKMRRAFTNSPSFDSDVFIVRVPGIPKNCILLAPNIGAIPSGSTYTVKWSASSDAVKFDLKYSMNNGTTWKTIANKVTGTSYDWSVSIPMNNKMKCLVKVIGYNASDMKVGEDTSDSTFTIEVVKVTSPDGGETLESGKTHVITWRTNATIDPVAKVYLSYTDNGGGTWRSITTLNSNTGSYPWSVPYVGTKKKKCKVEVILRDASGKTVGSDKSDSNFKIVP